MTKTIQCVLCGSTNTELITSCNINGEEEHKCNDCNHNFINE